MVANSVSSSMSSSAVWPALSSTGCWSSNSVIPTSAASWSGGGGRARGCSTAVRAPLALSLARRRAGFALAFAGRRLARRLPDAALLGAALPGAATGLGVVLGRRIDRLRAALLGDEFIAALHAIVLPRHDRVHEAAELGRLGRLGLDGSKVFGLHHLANEELLADGPQVGGHPVDEQAGREPEQEEHEHDGHRPHDHLLRLVG